MNEIYQHMKPVPHPETEHDHFFQSAGLPFDRSKEEVWETLSGKLTEMRPARVVRFRPSRLITAAAAAIALLLGTFLVMRYYSVTLTSGHGEYQSALLPDGSGVELNAGSRLSYHPLWWRFSRLVSFEGEGYFEVARGKTFQVESERGTTEVLGTSFTIYARSDEYRVTCFTGAVKVVSETAQHAILNPDYQARIDAGGNIVVTREAMPETVNGWISGMFSFTAHPLRLVLEEIERQYDVRIILHSKEEYLYTGHFSRDKSVEEALGLICKPFGLNFALRPDRAYEILPK